MKDWFGGVIGAFRAAFTRCAQEPADDVPMALLIENKRRDISSRRFQEYFEELFFGDVKGFENEIAASARNRLLIGLTGELDPQEAMEKLRHGLLMLGHLEEDILLSIVPLEEGIMKLGGTRKKPVTLQPVND